MTSLIDGISTGWPLRNRESNGYQRGWESREKGWEKQIKDWGDDVQLDRSQALCCVSQRD